MDGNDFILSLKRQWNEACLSAGIPAISEDSAATILAVVYLYGNNEGLVMNPMFLEDVRYIKKRYNIDGGEVPDAGFSVLLKERIGELEEYDRSHQGENTTSGLFERHIPEYVMDFFKERYGIKLF